MLEDLIQKVNKHEVEMKTQEFSTDWLTPLDFRTEKRTIKSIIKDSKKEINFKSSVATDKAFTEMMKENPRILHISCHGLNLTLKHGPNYDPEMVEKEHCLLFEKENGEGHLINSKTLNQLLLKSVESLDLIVLAACNSEFAGKIFLKCGAKHVICIKKDKEVLDDAAIDFSNHFYSEILNGVSICKAFDDAKERVKFLHGSRESTIFTIFIQE